MASDIEVIRDPAKMRARAEALRRDGQRIGVVPTMGYLHEGHLSLLRLARRQCDVLVVTIFVNPTQFGPNEDLARYPRDEQGDLDKARQCGADIGFCPDVGSMYPAGYQTYVTVEEIAQPLCGAVRPGHFRGVATVVTKLFHTTLPHVAVFGQKDYQQLALLRRMCVDLDFGVELIGAPIVREPDGLALSSRNVYLSEPERAQAVCLWQGLTAARQRFDSGVRQVGTLLETARTAIDAAALARTEYVELRDAETLEEIVGDVDRPAVLAAAVRIGTTRLIDNTLLTP